MVELIKNGVYLVNGKELVSKNCDSSIEIERKFGKKLDEEKAKKGTIAYGILSSHNTSGNEENLKIKFDAMASHDITYVGIIQTARASGLEKFPIPYVMTNCHNSLCAVGGTINEDDHVFGLSAAKKYGGIYVPAHEAVIHSYMREMMSGCGKMLLGSDSHTRYGALGTMAIGEGGPELVKQLLCRTYDIKRPEVVCVYLTGKLKPGVGPQDVAIALIGAVFKSGFVKNKVLEFVGDGVANLPIEFRNGIDVMTTETTCLSSIWITDDKTKKYFENHKRADEYKQLSPADIAYYDGAVVIDLSTIECMIALPFHPSNAYTIKELNENPYDILKSVEESAVSNLGLENGRFNLTDKIKGGRLTVDQGVVAGCAGGIFDNLCAVADILDGYSCGANEFALSAYPASQPAYIELVKNGVAAKLMTSGITLRTAFCGPCFGAGDVPANGALSIRHSTRNFPNREGSKPANGQIASVALMDARSIAATARNGGKLTAASELDIKYTNYEYHFDDTVYKNRVYFGYSKADTSKELKFGPNIADWPEMTSLCDNLLIKVVSYIKDAVTTTDELIPSGETSSYRSNPLKLAEFALSRKDPEYVGRAKAVQIFEKKRMAGENPFEAELETVYALISSKFNNVNKENCEIGSAVFAKKPGDGSAREQAASCQKVLGGVANIANEYATKRYRSNLINWGMIPFIIDDESQLALEDYIFIPGIRTAVKNGDDCVDAYVVRGNKLNKITLRIPDLSSDDRDIILDGCLINYYRSGK